MASWNHDMMEKENNRMAENLAGKISRLKMISMDIKGSIDDDVSYLDGMNSDMSSVSGFLSGSVNRFKKMVGSGKSNRKLMGRIVVFTVLIFFLFYFFWPSSK